MAYGYNELKQIWILNGGNPQAAGIAAAVALAESGGNPNATNTNGNGTIDRGLWQINSIHGNLSTYDITANAKAAIQISSNGTNWMPWTVYKTGAYKKFLNSADPSLVGTVEISPKPPEDTNPLTALVSNFTQNMSQLIKAGEWFAKPENTIRIFQVVSGGGLIIAGLVILNRGLVEDVMGKVVDIGKMAAEAGAVAA